MVAALAIWLDGFVPWAGRGRPRPSGSRPGRLLGQLTGQSGPSFACPAPTAPAGPVTGQAGVDHQDEVAALDLGDRRRARAAATVPATGAVIAASIFIASMVATVAPASTWSPSATVTVTTPANGAATCPGLAGSAFSATLTSTLIECVADPDRAQLAVDGAHHGPHAALVRAADRLQAEDQADAAADPDDVLVARAAARRGSPGCPAGRRRRRSPGCAGTPWSGPGTAAGSASPAGPARRRPAPPSRPRASSASRTGTVRPCSALVRNGSGQPPGGSPSSPPRKPITESGMS